MKGVLIRPQPSTVSSQSKDRDGHRGVFREGRGVIEGSYSQLIPTPLLPRTVVVGGGGGGGGTVHGTVPKSSAGSLLRAETGVYLGEEGELRSQSSTLSRRVEPGAYSGRGGGH